MCRITHRTCCQRQVGANSEAWLSLLLSRTRAPLRSLRCVTLNIYPRTDVLPPSNMHWEGKQGRCLPKGCTARLGKDFTDQFPKTCDCIGESLSNRDRFAMSHEIVSSKSTPAEHCLACIMLAIVSTVDSVSSDDADNGLQSGCKLECSDLRP